VLNPETPVSHAIPPAPNSTFNEQWLRLEGLEHKYERLHVSETMNVKPGHDYVVHVPLKLEQGRLRVKITDEKQSAALAAVGVDLLEGVSAAEQPVRNVTIPFVSAKNSGVRLVIENFAVPHSRAAIGASQLVELGPSSYQWLRYVRQPIRLVQRFFKTVWVLPFVVLGFILMARQRDWQSLALLLAVPAYYLVVQSTLHTERRYVYVIHFFFLIFASAALWRLGTMLYGFAAGFLATHKPETPKGKFV
jgi:hypothetical protein